MLTKSGILAVRKIFGKCSDEKGRLLAQRYTVKSSTVLEKEHASTRPFIKVPIYSCALPDMYYYKALINNEQISDVKQVQEVERNMRVRAAFQVPCSFK